MNKPQRDIHVDHDEIDRTCRELHQIVEQLDQIVATDVPAVLDTLIRESSAHTASGQPAPIFVPVLHATETAMCTVVEVLGQMRQQILADIDNLQRGSAETKRIEALAVEEIGTAAEGTEGIRLTKPGQGIPDFIDDPRAVGQFATKPKKLDERPTF